MKKQEKKQIVCKMVEATKIVPKDKKRSKRAFKAKIESGNWIFQCESYSYKRIKEELEKAICSICDLESVEVKNFLTDIVEYP